MKHTESTDAEPNARAGLSDINIKGFDKANEEDAESEKESSEPEQEQALEFLTGGERYAQD